MLGDLIKNFINQMGFFTEGSFELLPFLLRLVMILVACVLIYLAIAKGFEPYLLILLLSYTAVCGNIPCGFGGRRGLVCILQSKKS